MNKHTDMKRKIIISGMLITLLSSCNSTGDISIDDFESGNFDKWTIEGDAFGNAPSQGSYTGQQEVTGFEGKHLANSFHNGDDSRGVLISKEFMIERNYINFLIGGGMHEDTFIELIIEGKPIFRSSSLVESENLQWLSWNVKPYINQKANIRIVDNQRGGWGHILIDQIEQSNQSKSKFMTDYKLSFDATQKYILLPIEDEASETKIQLWVASEKIGEPIDVRLAKSKIDYWMPIPIEDYKGKNIELTFSPMQSTDMGYQQIKQSDVFEFNKDETYRPIYHFTPPYGWMNDPNGMVYHNGTYHLFYQYNPYGTKWGNMHWGHAISKNLYKWEHLPVALFPDKLGTIFSGSAIIDQNNTAGFGKDALIAIYTSAGKSQTQSIAYSLDNGRTFQTYEHNPVLSDPNIVDFRDPKVFWHEDTQQWIMSLATSQTITFYGSKNLKQWEKLSEFGQGIGAHGGVWECPDLFPLKYNGKTKWVLFVSINPGGINGGSATQYFIGNFDGKTFVPDAMNYPLWLDYGRDNYAGVTWSNIPASDGRRLFIGWMSNWDYGTTIPTENFRSAMTIPRELKLAHNGEHLVVSSLPAEEMKALRKETKTAENIVVSKQHTLEELLKTNEGAYELNFVIQPQHTEVFEFKLFNQKNEQVVFTFDLKQKNFAIDRLQSGNVGFNPNFAPKPIKAPIVKKDSYKIQLFVDKNSIEVFINDGEVVQTNTIFPSQAYNALSFSTEQGQLAIKDISIHKLK